MRPDFPLVVPKTRTIRLGDGHTLTQERFALELNEQSLADIRAYMHDLIVDDTQQQINLGNPPNISTVDGRTDKRIEDIQRQAVVIFGAALPKEAMQLVVRELQRAIISLDLKDTGALSNMQNWQWVFIRKGQGPLNISSGSPPEQFVQGDQLVLSPDNVPYASWANFRAKQINGSKGFMALATAAVRKLPVFKQFACYTLFTSKYSVAGETYPHGTPIIVIRPRIRRSR